MHSFVWFPVKFSFLFSIVTDTFLWSGRHPDVLLSRARIQSFFPPAIGPAPSPKRSQSSPLCVLVVCQMCFPWRLRANPEQGHGEWPEQLSLISQLQYDWIKQVSIDYLALSLVQSFQMGAGDVSDHCAVCRAHTRVGGSQRWQRRSESCNKLSKSQQQNGESAGKRNFSCGSLCGRRAVWC